MASGRYRPGSLLLSCSIHTCPALSIDVINRFDCAYLLVDSGLLQRIAVISRMDRKKCARCGLVNRDVDDLCRRCGASLDTVADSAVEEKLESPKKRGLGKRILWILSTTLLILFGSYISLLATSNDLTYQERQIIERAVSVLADKGFDREVTILGLAKYRGSDNWWNRLVGHHDAYAATNFPFELVTVYPEFFAVSIDDTERAAILLHEAYHLRGTGEQTALEGVWREKERLGWMADQYSHSKIWNNTRELTRAQIPHLFQCGSDGKSDCTEHP